MKMNLNNYEAYLLLYIDNELSIEERKEVEIFIKANPVYEAELNKLMQTKLPLDHIVFEDKVLLYRFEEMEAGLSNTFKKSLYREEAKVVTGFFTRARLMSVSAIAALLLLIIGYRFYFHAQVTSHSSISQNIDEKNKIKFNQKEFRKETTSVIENNIIAMHKSKANQKTEDKLFTSNILELTKAPNFNSEELNTASKVNLAPETITQSIALENTMINIPENNNPAVIENSNTMTAVTNNSNIEQEVFNNLNTDDPDRSVYIANFEIDGDKLRGISRRINAFLKRNKNEKQK